jgi:predicted dehydrogenase
MGYRSGALLFISSLVIFSGLYAQEKLPSKPLRVGVVGLVHDHVHGILGRENKGDIEIVGIAEPNHDLAVQLSKQHGYDMKLVYSTMEEMIEKTKPDAVLAFNTIYDHLKVVEYCAPRGIHVMVEKPLAVSMEHAGKMVALARKYKIILLTNYETTWYGSNEMAYQLTLNENKIGDIRKIVFHTGHRGPVEIGCSPQFLAWLTDPVLNGGGALTDFGCYGADLATWFMKGEEPISVTAVTQHIKPDLYPKVEDEATIVLTYPTAQVIIEASWNWPYGRKDMELYGKTGYIFCKDATQMVFRANEKSAPENITAPPLPSNRNDPFIYFANVIRGDIKMSDNDLSSLHNNETVIKILDAAKLSAKKGTTVNWKELYH